MPAAGEPVGDLRPAQRQPAALGRVPRRARGPAADPRLPRRPRRNADQGARARHLARHQPGLGDDGGLRGRQSRDERARRRRHGRPAGEDRRGPRPDRLPDADQPEHARALRREHRGDRRADPRGGGDALLRRGEPERDHGADAARRHGLRHRPPEPAQVLQPAARRRRAGGGADRGQLADRAVPAAAAGGPARGLQRPRPELRPRLRPAQVDRAAARLPGQLRRLRALLRLHPQPRRRRPHRGLGDRGAERQLPESAARRGAGRGAAADRLRPPLHARVRPLRAADEKRARAGDARPRQAAARLRLPPADRLLPAAGRRGADGRADRDRDEGEPRRLRRRDRGDPHRGRDRSRAGQERPLLDPGAPAGRGAGDAQAGGAPGDRCRGWRRRRGRGGREPRGVRRLRGETDFNDATSPADSDA